MKETLDKFGTCKTEEPNGGKPEEPKTDDPKQEKPEEPKTDDPKQEKPEEPKTNDPKQEKPEEPKTDGSKQENQMVQKQMMKTRTTKAREHSKSKCTIKRSHF